MKLPSQLGQKLKGLEHGTSCQAAMSISPKLPLLPNSPFSPNSPTFRGPSSWVNLFTLIISSTTLVKFRQNRHFRHCLQFWTYLESESPCKTKIIAKQLNYDGIKFLVTIKQINKIEWQNNLRVNMFIYEKSKIFQLMFQRRSLRKR